MVGSSEPTTRVYVTRVVFLIPQGRTEVGAFKIGQKLIHNKSMPAGGLYTRLHSASSLIIVGFQTDGVVVQENGRKVLSIPLKSFDVYFEKPE